MIQSLALTLRIKSDDVAVLDALRRKSNLSDYSGDPIDAETLREAVSRVEALIRGTQDWLNRHHSNLIEGAK